EDLPRNRHAERPGRGTQHRRTATDHGVAGGERRPGEVLNQRPEGYVLTEGHPVHLLVAAGDRAGAAPRRDEVFEPRVAGVLHDAGDEGRVQAAGESRQLVALGRISDVDDLVTALVGVHVDDVLGPHDEVD